MLNLHTEDIAWMDLDCRADAWLALISTVLEGTWSPLHSYHCGKYMFLRKWILLYFGGKQVSVYNSN